jgi:hypothetical protein
VTGVMVGLRGGRVSEGKNEGVLSNIDVGNTT